MNNRTTKTLVVLSVVGALWYFPYMWYRSQETVVNSKFRICNTVETHR